MIANGQPPSGRLSCDWSNWNTPRGRSPKSIEVWERPLGNGDGSGEGPGEYGRGARGGSRNAANVAIDAADWGKYTAESIDASARLNDGISSSGSRSWELRADSRPARYALERRVSLGITVGSGGMPDSLSDEV